MRILGAIAATRLRPGAAGHRDASGRWVAETDDELAIRTTLQPLTGDELQSLPEGERSSHWRKGQTTAQLRTAEADGELADRIQFEGQGDDDGVYEVRSVARQTAVLKHTSWTGVRLREVG